MCVSSLNQCADLFSKPQAFLIIIFIGIGSAFLVLGPHRIIRTDGSLVKLQAKAKVQDEVKGVLALFVDWRMLGLSFLCAHCRSDSCHKYTPALLPMSFASNYFYAYQGAINTAKFDGPTRALNGTLSAAGAIVGAVIIGFIVLDGNYGKRRTRGYIGLAVVTSLTIIIWACGLSFQVSLTPCYCLLLLRSCAAHFHPRGSWPSSAHQL